MPPIPAHVALTFSANRCVVDVDPELGLARVVQMDVAQYGGRIVNPAQAHGQIAGGSLMGLGLALSESLDYADGQLMNGDWGGYLIPTLADAPLVNCEVSRFARARDPEWVQWHCRDPACAGARRRALRPSRRDRSRIAASPGDSGADCAGGEG